MLSPFCISQICLYKYQTPPWQAWGQTPSPRGDKWPLHEARALHPMRKGHGFRESGSFDRCSFFDAPCDTAFHLVAQSSFLQLSNIKTQTRCRICLARIHVQLCDSFPPSVELLGGMRLEKAWPYHTGLPVQCLTQAPGSVVSPAAYSGAWGGPVSPVSWNCYFLSCKRLPARNRKIFIKGVLRPYLSPSFCKIHSVCP